MSDGLKMSRRIRRTPYTNRIEKAGVRGFSVVNHMLLPRHSNLLLKRVIGILEIMFKYGMFLVNDR